MAQQAEYSDTILERNTLAAVLQDQEEVVSHLSLLLPKHFTDANVRRLFVYVKQLALGSGVAPTKETLRVELVGRFPRAQEVTDGLLAIYEQLTSLSVDAPIPFLVRKLATLSQVRDALSSTEQFLRTLDEGEIETALQQYQDDALTLQAADWTTVVTRGEVIQDYEKRKATMLDMQLHPEKYRGVLTGVDDLDKLTGGLWDGELGFVFGKSGVGKSFLLLEFAFQAYRSGYTVLVIPIEMPLAQWERRFDSRISHVAYDHFKLGTLTAAEMEQWEQRIKIMEERYSAKGGNIFISHIPMGCTLGSIRVELEKLIQQGTPVQLLIVDYADLMSPPRQLYSEQGELTAIFRELKGMAGVYNIPIWTATQSKRESYKSVYLTMEDVGYAQGKAHVSDLVVGIARSDEGALTGRMMLSIAKYRDGAYNKPIELRTNLALAMVNAVGV